MLDSLIELKTQVINSYYANPNANPNANQHNILQTPNARELLPAALFDSNTNTSMDTNSGELLNAVISYLDKQIQDAKYQLSSICKKATRLDKTITATANDLKTKQDNSSTSREKVVSYKDNYKNAKLIKTSLEERLNNLQARLNSWDFEVIDNVKQEYKMKLDSLAADTLRAQERLNIMTSRITNDHESNIITLECKIKQVENELAETNNLLKQTNQELALLLEKIAKNNSTKIELEKINTQIANVEIAIAKIQMDIASLSI